MTDVLLDLEDLRVTFSNDGNEVTVVDGLDLRVRRGEKLALVGESGSGKSVTAQAVLGILRGAEVSGRRVFNGVDLGTLGAKRYAALRGNQMGLVFQDPLSSLNPVMTVGDQITEGLRIRGVSRREATRRAVDLLARLGVPRAAERLRDYPHEFSGGMRQRVMIALAIINEPELLIADEPTTALDVRVQQQVMDLLYELAEERDMAVLLITHDLGIVAGFADRVVVMYAGRQVEDAPTSELFARPRHPYTRGLLDAVPRIDAHERVTFRWIPGSPPPPGERPQGCAFHPRCSFARPECIEAVPDLRAVGASHAACIRATELDEEQGGTND